MSRGLIGRDDDQWNRAAAPGAGRWQGGAGRDGAQSAAEPLGLARARRGDWATQARAAGLQAALVRLGQRWTVRATANPRLRAPSSPAPGPLRAHALDWFEAMGEGSASVPTIAEVHTPGRPRNALLLQWSGQRLLPLHPQPSHSR